HGFAKNVVIKRLLPHLARETGYTAMFIDEAKLTARLVHPKIAQTFELGRVGEQLFIAMEMVDGVDVLSLLREFAARHDKLPADLAVWVAHEVLDALDYAHALPSEDGTPLGVVHRDISPSNILLSRRGDVKLVDFGIARARAPNRHHRTKSGTLKGKYGYMSPEQVLEQPVDRRSDLFSVGIVLAEMLMGRRLFAAPNELDVLLMVRDARLGRLDEYGKHIGPDLDAIVRRALRKDPDERYNTAGEMRDAIDDWLFQHRMRVNPKKVGDMVENVYEAVWARQRSLLSGDVGVDDVLETPQVQRTSAAPDLADGIPRGVITGNDSLPIISVEETPAPLEISPPTQRPRPVVKIPPKEPQKRATGGPMLVARVAPRSTGSRNEPTSEKPTKPLPIAPA
ncbi:MAG: serine/threonine-protein kinase, partial [Myxococcota bacterium]